MSGAPPPVNPSLLSVLEAQSTRYVLALLGFGLNEYEVQTHLRDRFPGLGGNQARAAYQRALAARTDAANVNFGGGGAVAQAKDYQKGLAGQTGYRYYALVTVTGDDGTVRRIPVTVHSAAGLSRNAITALAESQIWEIHDDIDDAARRRYDLVGEITVGSTEVYAAERATPP